MKNRLMKIFNKRSKNSVKGRDFGDFLMHATPKEKERVFTEAARKANEDQRKLLNLESAR